MKIFRDIVKSKQNIKISIQNISESIDITDKEWSVKEESKKGKKSACYAKDQSSEISS
jgi:hypothetical protein